jgi:2-polyprenyl-6-methoxyphenol hydroxylase-like FAD-dependent oxidoreductase
MHGKRWQEETHHGENEKSYECQKVRCYLSVSLPRAGSNLEVTDVQENDVITQTNKSEHVETTTCCIVGSGPAGAVMALLLARKGIPVMLLEEHMDFDRDFRGDSIHPSTMQIMDEIGLAERLLQLRHTELHTLSVQASEGTFTLADFRHLKTRFSYIAMIPQVHFLEFITIEAKRYPNFQLVMGARVEKLIEENGEVRGVHYRGQDGWHEVRATLIVGADGRFSRLRRLAGFELIKTAPPMDVLWFRVPYKPGESEESRGRIGVGHFAIVLNRADHWQMGYAIPKGGYQEIKAAGLEKLREAIAALLPDFADRMESIQEWKQVSVLSVESSRLPKWYLPGLLLIGDAAHVMSPVGGVGINYAIQDAVVAANVLTEHLKAGKVPLSDLAKVQRKRELPTRIIQGFQNMMQKQVLAKVLESDKPLTVSPVLRFILRIPGVRNLPAKLIAFGPVSVHVKNP